MTAYEIRGLEHIKQDGRLARYAALSFVAISMLGGIPVGKGPAILVLPSAMITCLVLCGVCWFLMMASIGKRMRSRCPRCRDLFFGIRQMRFLPLGLRALWGNHCGNCGLSLRELSQEKVRLAAAAMLRAAGSATGQGMQMASAATPGSSSIREYVTLKRPSLATRTVHVIDSIPEQPGSPAGR